MADGKKNVVGIGVFAGLMMLSAYAGFGVRNSISETQPVKDRIREKYTQGKKLSTFDYRELLRSGTDKFTSEYGSWSMAGLVWNLPEPLDQVAPDGFCFWLKCERVGPDCVGFEECGFGRCDNFEEAAAHPETLGCYPIWHDDRPLF